MPSIHTRWLTDAALQGSGSGPGAAEQQQQQQQDSAQTSEEEQQSMMTEVLQDYLARAETFREDLNDKRLTVEHVVLAMAEVRSSNSSIDSNSSGDGGNSSSSSSTSSSSCTRY